MLEPIGKFTAHAVKFSRVRALKGIDGLLFVSDHKNGARLFGSMRALAGCELLRQPLDHLPLFRACVLGFVDQNMINTAVQSIENPSRHRRVIQQITRPQDQVVKVQPAQFLLLIFVPFHETMPKAPKRHGSRRTRQPQSLITRAFDPRHKIVEFRHQIREIRLQFLGRNRPYFGRKRVFCCRTRQKYFFQRGEVIIVKAGNSRQFVRVFVVGCRPSPQR